MNYFSVIGQNKQINFIYNIALTSMQHATVTQRCIKRLVNDSKICLQRYPFPQMYNRSKDSVIRFEDISLNWYHVHKVLLLLLLLLFASVSSLIPLTSAFGRNSWMWSKPCTTAMLPDLWKFTEMAELNESAKEWNRLRRWTQRKSRAGVYIIVI